ncbi:MAG TPA: helix-turn-helix domain-containing protein, partial [Telluria sp.]|nr:helix-turn-helix domain-containing protein [Telluria sp.]
MKTIVVLALEGVMESSLAITLDTIRTGQSFLARSPRAGGVRLLVAGYRTSVPLGASMRLQADLTFANVLREVPAPDWVIVPGLGLVSDAAIAARFAQKDALAAAALLARLPETTRIGASCSAVFLLAETGLLAGRQCTMTWWLAKLFRQRHADARLDENMMLVRDGRFLTAGSAFAQLDLTLAVVAETMGTSVAELCSRYLLIDRRPSQARYMVHTHTRHVDPTVVAAERWIDAHIDQPIAVAALAGALGVSPKTLARRIDAAIGMSPVKFIQQRRLQHAVHLIETTTW